MTPTLLNLKLLLSEVYAGEPERELLLLLEATRELITLPNNDFTSSSWRDASHALMQIDGLISLLRNGDLPSRLAVAVIYTPAGPLHELSLTSGWADTCLEIVSKFDSLESRLW
jgi:hypothetical protein